MLDEKVERLERERLTEPLDKFLATLSVAELDTVEHAIASNPEPIERRLASGEPPIAVLKGIL